MKHDRKSDTMVFMVETRRGSRAEITKLRRTVNRTLGPDADGRRWQIGPAFPRYGLPPSALDRYIRVTGRVDAPQQKWDKLAFETAYKLRDSTGLSVEPDLPSSIFAPPVGLRPQPSGEPPGSDVPSLALSFGQQTQHLPATAPFTWALDFINARQAWALQPGPGGKARGEGIMVVHPDTGYTNLSPIDLSNFDLDHDKDLLSNDDDALDPLEQWGLLPVLQPGHGTTASSVIVGKMMHDIQGVAPLAKVVPVRTIKSVWQVFNSDVARAVNYARQIRAHVVSMSLGGILFQGGLEEAINAAIDDGMLVLAAAGNFVHYVVAPAIYERCIAVAGVNANDQPWPGSCQGEKVAFSAPGESVWAAEFFFEPAGTRLDIARQSGTTFAVSMSAGVAALWLAHHGRDNLIATYGKSRLQSVFLHLINTLGHRRPAGWDSSNFGVGIIDASGLLSAPLPAPADVPDFAPLTLGLAATRPSAADRIARLFPTLTRNEVDQRLETLFGLQGAALDESLEKYGAELTWILSEQQAARDTFEASPVGIAPTLTLARADGGRVSKPLMAQFSSPSLAASLQQPV